ncbi:MAG: IS630 family transposase [Patescibacteria group bacterium]
MLKTNITKEEKILLRSHRKQSALELVRLKATAVLMWSNGMSDVGVADVAGRSERQVALWRRAWNKCRMASIFSGHADNNNAGKLTPDQQLQIKEALSQAPSAYGIPKTMWDVPTLKEYVSATFSVVYESDESYYFLLRFSGLSFKYPDTFDRKRDEVLIAERMEAIRTEIRPLLHRNDWEVFACDEVKMQQEAVIRRAWLKRGQRTVVKVNRDKRSQSYIGFLNQRTHQCHLYEMPWQNSDEVLKATEQFLTAYPNKKICIVWDNAPFHKSLKIREQLKTGGLLERVHLIAMPPYAPDNNPIEHVWNTAKQAVANIQQDTFEQTKQAFSDFVASRLFRYSF